MNKKIIRQVVVLLMAWLVHAEVCFVVLGNDLDGLAAVPGTLDIPAEPDGGVVAGVVEHIPQASDYKHVTPALGWGQVLKSIGTVVAVLGVLLGLNLYIRRRSVQWKVSGGRQIRLVEQLSLDARRRLILLEVGGRGVLLAVTPQQVTSLSEWPVEGGFDEIKSS